MGVPVVFPRNLDTTHVVSWWHIPGGCDYHNATPCIAFFDNKEAAKEFAREKGDYPPEMATVYTIEQYDASTKVESPR